MATTINGRSHLCDVIKNSAWLQYFDNKLQTRTSVQICSILPFSGIIIHYSQPNNKRYKKNIPDKDNRQQCHILYFTQTPTVSNL